MILCMSFVRELCCVWDIKTVKATKLFLYFCVSDHAAQVCRRDTTYISHHELTRVARQIYCWEKVELHSTFTFVTLVCIQKTYTGMNGTIECSGNIYPRFEVVVYPHRTHREWDVFINEWKLVWIRMMSHMCERWRLTIKRQIHLTVQKQLFSSLEIDAKTTIDRKTFYNTWYCYWSIMW